MKKAQFIEQLAKFLVENQVWKSVALQMEQVKPKHHPIPSFAKEWSALRQSTPLFGYPTKEEAVLTLTEFLK